MSRIAVVDLGTGNLHSVSKALERVAPDRVVEITHDPAVIRASGHVVLPGQGAIGSWFHALDEWRLREVVTDVLTARPILGICLGLQALYAFSEEDGGTAGFGIMAGNVRRFPIRHEAQGQLLKVPHMGWNAIGNQQGGLFEGIEKGTDFYFVHSYYVPTSASSVAQTNYGISFTSALQQNNFYAVQFHPEKSGESGERLLLNFLNIQP